MRATSAFGMAQPCNVKAEHITKSPCNVAPLWWKNMKIKVIKYLVVVKNCVVGLMTDQVFEFRSQKKARAFIEIVEKAGYKWKKSGF